jgi:glutathione S-transferase
MQKDSQDRFRLYGVLGSPYVAKLRALLRYRHIPFNYVPASFDWAPSFNLVKPELEHVKPRLIPVVWFPSDGTYRVDSTRIARDLEEQFEHRRTVPGDPALAFISMLLEDMGDEWLLKIAFQYRWGNEEDRNLTNRLVMGELLGGGVPQDVIARAAAKFRDRQISRMPLVGCTPTNLPAIEATFTHVLHAMDTIRERRPFLLGTRPSLGDFGMFGALFTCKNDPTAGKFIREHSMATMDWLYALDEASGVEGEWLGVSELGEGIVQLLRVAGEAYLPFLVENKRAYERQLAEVSLKIFGHEYKQSPFRYQAKCLDELRNAWAAMPERATDSMRSLMMETRCLEALENAG